MAELPGGTLTFLLTDVEGSTSLWEQAPAAMRAALARHDVLFEDAIRQHHGEHIRPRGEGDSRFAVFASAADAVSGAITLQRALVRESWPTPGPVRVRIGLHTGEAELRDGDYYGLAVNRCARLRAVGHGGQILLSEVTARLVDDSLPAQVTLRALGEHRLRHLTQPERIFQVVAPGLPAAFPRLATIDAELGSFTPGGERRDITVLFSDVRGFTDLVETREPVDVFVTLNEYLTVMSDVIYDLHGTLDKFVGDGILAFWGAPVRQDDHAGLACRAALRMVEELDRLNARWGSAGRQPLTMSIGINTGLMLVGNVGSVSRFDYTVMGEAVNVGSRLERMNRAYRTKVIAAAATIERTSGFRTRLLDRVPVGSDATPVPIYELIGSTL